jgi:hypothetical protein
MLNEREQAEFDAIVTALREDRRTFRQPPAPFWYAVALGLSMVLLLIGVATNTVILGIVAFVFAVTATVQLIRMVGPPLSMKFRR